jgi:cyclic pyranopterin phosphate synthase
MMNAIRDEFGRTFRTLRVSLLSRCNLGCVYCVEGTEAMGEMEEMEVGKGMEATEEMEGGRMGKGDGQLSTAELVQVIGRLHGQLGLRTVRLTGGEPLLYGELTRLLSGIRLLGVSKVSMTTNGYLLERKAQELKEAGLDSINVSLDAVDEEAFFRMSRRHSVGRVVRGIDAARGAGMEVKINAVLMKGLNDGQILPLLEFAFSRGITIRFLEVMAMGHLYHHSGRYLLSRDEILQAIGGRYSLRPVERGLSATARYWETEGGARFGIIANESEPFCGDCDRLRLDSSGHIYGCLSSNRPILLGLAEGTGEWEKKLRAALGQKQELRFTGSELSMLEIGG